MSQRKKTGRHTNSKRKSTADGKLALGYWSTAEFLVQSVVLQEWMMERKQLKVFCFFHYVSEKTPTTLTGKNFFELLWKEPLLNERSHYWTRDILLHHRDALLQHKLVSAWCNRRTCCCFKPMLPTMPGRFDRTFPLQPMQPLHQAINLFYSISTSTTLYCRVAVTFQIPSVPLGGALQIYFSLLFSICMWETRNDQFSSDIISSRCEEN